MEDELDPKRLNTSNEKRNCFPGDLTFQTMFLTDSDLNQHSFLESSLGKVKKNSSKLVPVVSSFELLKSFSKQLPSTPKGPESYMSISSACNVIKVQQLEGMYCGVMK